ncbi:MAG: CheR family methyltransferase [Bacillota bacterium]
MNLEEFRQLRDYVNRKCGLFFPDRKLYYVERRVRIRMQALGLASFKEYLRYLISSPSEQELQRLLDVLTITETFFFREVDQLNCLAQHLLPQMLDGPLGRVRPEIRVLSAGCSTGEEAYTAAIILDDTLRKLRHRHLLWHVLGTDVNTSAIQRAQQGVYTQRSVRAVPHHFLEEYFVAQGSHFEIAPRLRRHVTFAWGNLFDQKQVATWGTFDIVLCRNVLIYFDEKSRWRAIENLEGILKPGGFLLLGQVESLNRIPSALLPKRFGNATVFQKTPVQAGSREARFCDQGGDAS